MQSMTVALGYWASSLITTSHLETCYLRAAQSGVGSHRFGHPFGFQHTPKCTAVGRIAVTICGNCYFRLLSKSEYASNDRRYSPANQVGEGWRRSDNCNRGEPRQAGAESGVWPSSSRYSWVCSWAPPSSLSPMMSSPSCGPC
ncbi:hypothetical protein F5Y18DRAFT_179409 [Xylariaceae sp. FL1019]|nr:hypothetical protein F5Y18DRAFT_179409 [Xylariaceae sp. FL1019]